MRVDDARRWEVGSVRKRKKIILMLLLICLAYVLECEGGIPQKLKEDELWEIKGGQDRKCSTNNPDPGCCILDACTVSTPACCERRAITPVAHNVCEGTQNPNDNCTESQVLCCVDRSCYKWTDEYGTVNCSSGGVIGGQQYEGGC